MSDYRKEIEIEAANMVLARVYAPDGRKVGTEYFYGLLNSNAAMERYAKRAHAWADERIALCRRYEIPAANTKDQ